MVCPHDTEIPSPSAGYNQLRRRHRQSVPVCLTGKLKYSKSTAQKYHTQITTHKIQHKNTTQKAKTKTKKQKSKQKTAKIIKN